MCEQDRSRSDGLLLAVISNGATSSPRHSLPLDTRPIRSRIGIDASSNLMRRRSAGSSPQPTRVRPDASPRGASSFRRAAFSPTTHGFNDGNEPPSSINRPPPTAGATIPASGLLLWSETSSAARMPATTPATSHRALTSAPPKGELTPLIVVHCGGPVTRWQLLHSTSTRQPDHQHANGRPVATEIPASPKACGAVRN